MKKKSKFYKNYMNRTYKYTRWKLFNYLLYACGQCYSMPKLVNIALSQMVISIFGLKRGHLIYLGPRYTTYVFRGIFSSQKVYLYLGFYHLIYYR